MRMRSSAYWLPKQGNTPDEYEDAFASSSTDSANAVFRYAVADGASEASFAGLWAAGLVEAYVTGKLRGGMRRALPAIQVRWEAEAGSKPLPWYAEEKRRNGSFAALIGLTLRSRAEGEVLASATAVGDCCLAQVRAGSLLRCFPLNRVEQFDNHPYLLATHRSSLADLDYHLRTTNFRVRADDFLYLMSDALACWFLGTEAGGQAPWDLISLDLSVEEFASLMDACRRQGEMRNDDVTALIVNVESTESTGCGLANTARL